MFEDDKQNPPNEPHDVRIAGNQSINGEILPPRTTENDFPNGGVRGVLQSLSDDGGRALGATGSSRLVAALYSTIESERDELKSDLKAERLRREAAELTIARISAFEAAQPIKVFAGNFLSISGGVIAGYGLSRPSIAGSLETIILTGFGIICVIVGLAVTYLHRKPER